MLESSSGVLCASEAAEAWTYCPPRRLAKPNLDLRPSLTSASLSMALDKVHPKYREMILLHEDKEQLLWNDTLVNCDQHPLWNDTLVKKGGGEGWGGAFLVPFVPLRNPSSCHPPDTNEQRAPTP